MFEHFTDQARQVLVLAQLEARTLHHENIGTHHLLLGIMQLDVDMPSQVLQSLGVPFDVARENLKRANLPVMPRPPKHLPFTEDAKKCLESALRESLQLGDNSIRTEHLLFGCIRRDGETVRAVYGIDPHVLRQAVSRRMVGYIPVTKPADVEQEAQPEEPVLRSSADILFDISLQEDHLEQLREELAEAQKRETGIDPSYQH